MTTSDVSSASRNSAVQPIIAGFYPDPSICRVGDELFIATSSFEYTPAVPLWRSRDIVTWHQVGHALSADPQFPAGRARSGGGIYAPTLRHHDGRFWMITTDVSGGKGQLLTTARDIAGPWTPAMRIDGILGIDPDLTWDEEGVARVTYSSNDDAVPGIAQVSVDLDTGRLLEAPRTVFAGTGAAYPEGPHLFRRGQWWYLLYAEGGTERGHCVSVARASTATGPFHAGPANPLLTRRSTVFPVQNTGHGDMVELADGRWVMAYLGVRARGGTPLYHANGRETFLAGVEWDADGWPHVLPEAFDIPVADTAFTDGFDAAALDLRWASPGAELASFVDLTGPGVLVHPSETSTGTASLLAVRTRDLQWRFEAVTDCRDGAAVRLRMDDRHWIEVWTEPDGVRMEARIGPASLERADAVAPTGAVTLRVEALPATEGGPDDLQVSVSDDAGTRVLARIDGRYWTTEVDGLFNGRVIGVRARSVPARFSSVRYAPVEIDD